MNKAPVVIFLYNRPYQTIKTLIHLKKNSLCRSTDLIIFSDGFKKKNILDKKKVELVRNIIKNIDGFRSKKIFFRKRNFGLYKNIMAGLDTVFKNNDKAIILEDDIIVNKFFLKYLNKALQIYKADRNVSSIHGWFCEHNKKIPNTFFLRGSDIWGWATWKKSWKEFDKKPANLIKRFEENSDLIRKFNLNNSYDYYGLLKKRALGLNQSWGVLWNASNFLKKKFYLNFSSSLCINIGQDDSGVHSAKNTNYFNQKLNNKRIKIVRQKIIEDLNGEQIKVNFFKNFLNKPLLQKIINFLLRKINFTQKVISFIGPVDNWKIALKKSKGYNSNIILKNVLKNTLIAKNNLYLFERDGFLLKKNSISHNQLHLIMNIINKKNRSLNIVDFGGALASNYFKMKDIIDQKYKNKWSVIEQKNFVDLGNRTLKTKYLNFYNSINNIKNRNIDLIIFSGALQYLENPTELIEEVLKFSPEYVLIERLPIMSKQLKNEIYIQKKGKYSYPVWHFTKKYLQLLFQNKYKLIENLSSEFDHDFYFKNRKIKFCGYIYKLNKNKIC